MKQPSIVWNKFKKCFQETLNNLPPQKLGRLKSLTDRKHFFDEDVFPSIAHELDYLFRKEFLRIDFSFFSKGKNGWEVPEVFIESENNWESCYEEVRKLCSVNAPLKILIVYGFPEERKEEIDNDNHNDYYILQDFTEAGQLIGWYVILLYDGTGGEVKFHVYPYDESGRIIDSEKGSIIAST